MHLIVYAPFAASALLAVSGPRLAARMPPATGTRLLLTAGLACALTSSLSLVLLAATLIGRLPLVAAVGAWSGDRLRHADPVSPVTAKLAMLALLLLAFAVAGTTARRVRALRRARRACARLGPRSGRLVVLDQPVIEAFAVPAGRGRQGRIVVSTGMLRTLNAEERQVLLAHETAHLDHRHHRHRVLAALITAADPLLAPLPAAIHHLTERWADEDAAATVTDRPLAARALARAALAARHDDRPSPRSAVLCFGRSDVPGRVRALLAGTPARRPVIVAVLAATLTACLVSAAEAGNDTAHLFGRARHGYHARPLGITAATTHEARHLITVLDHRTDMSR
ncbi:M48 family metalloprotease [Actinoallomurus rhizosphaericola]|uniref:M48 family metalloprotease n=1 Tax=Actinoallomurus rhizosphaericola TaxID=2952536 RepID=UPI002093D361|nr:M48 family metalloprotease [Actinoallomurus rhizosphaericola]MCO5995298.1 M48 family metalloprotease [Actinoallomurus rhizosphaericola]